MNHDFYGSCKIGKLEKHALNHLVEHLADRGPRRTKNWIGQACRSQAATAGLLRNSEWWTMQEAKKEKHLTKIRRVTASSRDNICTSLQKHYLSLGARITTGKKTEEIKKEKAAAYHGGDPRADLLTSSSRVYTDCQ